MSSNAQFHFFCYSRDPSHQPTRLLSPKFNSTLLTLSRARYLSATVFGTISLASTAFFRSPGRHLLTSYPVLGIPHPAVATRDVALYQPFRNALRSPNQVIGLQTLMWHLMCRRCQDGQLHPVSSYDHDSPARSDVYPIGGECACCTRLVSDCFI